MKYRRGLCLLLLGCVLITSAGCFSARPLGTNPDTALPNSQVSLGALAIIFGSFGQINLIPSSCSSGGRQFFLGADFRDSKTVAVLKLVVDPFEGPAIRIFSSSEPFGQSIVFRRANCPVFDFTIESTVLLINDIEDLRISLQLDCITKDGNSLKGTISVTHCH